MNLKKTGILGCIDHATLLEDKKSFGTHSRVNLIYFFRLPMTSRYFLAFPKKEKPA